MVTPLLFALTVQAQVYSWTDKAGVQHFTDSLQQVPKGVAVRITEGEAISRIDSDQAKLAKAAQPVPVAAPPVAEQLLEEHWRRLFKEATGRVAALEEEIEADRRKVEEINGLPVNARYSCATGWLPHQQHRQWANWCFLAPNPEWDRSRERLDRNRRDLIRAKEDLQDLERRAAFEAVPLHWRH
jgi:Domain of unknown function (DUF4124)